MENITKKNENPLYMMFNEKHPICNNRFDTLDGQKIGSWHKLNTHFKDKYTKRQLKSDGWVCIKVFVNIIKLS